MVQPPQPDDESGVWPEDARIRLLRRMVMALLLLLMAAVIVVAAALVIRLAGAPRAVAPALPASLVLPPGETVQAATIGRGWLLVVTRDGTGQERLRLYDAESGRERQVMEVVPP